jgi:hypothetical protein
VKHLQKYFHYSNIFQTFAKIKENSMKAQNFILLFLVTFLSISTVKSQDEVFEFMKGGIKDGEKLFEAYFQPYGAVLGSNLNAGWFNTAKTHKFGGFDITLTTAAAFVPESDQTFDLSKIDFENLSLTNPDNYETPTIAGADNKGPFLEWRITNPISGNDTILTSFKAPEGTGFKAFPLPMIKAGIGLPGGFEIMGRYLPPVKIGNSFKIDMWGIGLKHDVIQYFPFAKNVPFINLSIMGAYSKIKSTSKINFPVYGNPDVQPTEAFDNQNLQLNCTGLTGNVLLSFDFPVITIYGGFGFSNAKTTLKATGNYPLTVIEASTGNKVVEVLKDPIDLEINSNDGGRYTGGLKFKMALVTIHAEYTSAKYNVFSAGIGISFR